MFDSIFNKI